MREQAVSICFLRKGQKELFGIGIPYGIAKNPDEPSPRGDAPSPLAFAKSCKGGDVSVLDPALAWDVCFIYLFI